MSKEKTMSINKSHNFNRCLLGEEYQDYDYYFTEDELKTAAEIMAASRKQIDDLENEKKAIVNDFKERIDLQLLLQKTNARIYRNKKESRQKACYKVADYEDCVVIYLDKETGEELSRRPMNFDERQKPLIFEPFNFENNNSQASYQ